MGKWYRKEENAISIFKQMLEGLSYCHKNGIIHKDLTLNNILITEDKKIKIIDFGLSIQTPTKTMELLQSQSNISLFSRSDLHAGTPLYLSPEQIDYIERLKKGEKIDEESVKTLFNEQIDIWSFGVIAYKLLTGFYPFSGGDNRELFYKIKNEKAKPPRDYNPSIPEGMNNLIMKCLEKDKAKRYKTAEEILEDLKKIEERLKNPHYSTIDSRQSITIEERKLEQLSQTEEQEEWEKLKTKSDIELIDYFVKTGKHKEEIANTLWYRLNFYLALYKKMGNERYINALKQLGADKDLKLEVLPSTGHTSWVSSVSFSTDGRYIVSGSYDVTVRLWDVNTGKEVAQLVYLTNGEWVIITSKGYYTCSKNGEKHINFVIDNKPYPTELFHPILYRESLNILNPDFK